MVMEIEDYLSALETHGRALADAARIDFTAPSPVCPGWTVRDVVEHTTMVHRWATRHVIEGLAHARRSHVRHRTLVVAHHRPSQP